MKSIVRRDTGEDWKEYLTRLMQEEGLIEEDDEPPSDEELRRFDKTRKDKKVSNDEWISPTDPDSRIAKMKDGTTHLAYKAEHVVDLETELILAAEIYHADHADTQTLDDSVHQAQINQQRGRQRAADRGGGGRQGLSRQRARSPNLREHTTYRTYIPEPERQHDRVWTDKPPEQKAGRVCQSPADARRARQESCSGCEASVSNGPSLTCARRAEPDEPGSPASRRCASAT